MIKNIRNKNLILFGIGAVQKSVLELLDNFFLVDPKKIRMIDILDYERIRNPDVDRYHERGARFIQLDINKNYKQIISELNPYDIIIDLTCYTCSLKILEECKKCNIHYINTSIEEEPTTLTKDEFHESYKFSHNEVNRINLLYPDKKSSIVCEFGMNPGGESVFAKIAILFLAQNTTPKTKELELYIKNRQFNLMAQTLGVELCLCTETDSARFLKDKDKDKNFNNTWSVPCFYEEAFEANCEFCYGSDQKTIPKGAELLDDNIIDLHKKSNKIYCEGFVPYDGKMIGTVVPHGENISLCTYLRNGNPEYCPTVHYVYRYSPLTFESLKYVNKKNLKEKLKTSHVMNNFQDPSFYGMDRVGCLICTKDKSVWAGSCLDNKATKYNSGTTQQVSAFVLSALTCLLEKPNNGIVFPEYLPENRIMELAEPYLGEVFVNFVDYHPKSLQWKDMQRTEKQFRDQF